MEIVKVESKAGANEGIVTPGAGRRYVGCLCGIATYDACTVRSEAAHALYIALCQQHHTDRLSKHFFKGGGLF